MSKTKKGLLYVAKSSALIFYSDPATSLFFVGVFVSAHRHPFLQRQHNLLITLNRSENYRHHRCQNTSHLKRGFSLYPLFGNLFELNLQVFSASPVDHWKVRVSLFSYRNEVLYRF